MGRSPPSLAAKIRKCVSDPHSSSPSSAIYHGGGSELVRPCSNGFQSGSHSVSECRRDGERERGSEGVSQRALGEDGVGPGKRREGGEPVCCSG